ncbi:MAG TPA: RNA polymerase sigma-54 factor, partial [Chloroflexota bacterium]
MAYAVELELSQETQQQLTQKVSPRLVAANYILELSSLELQQAIQQELAENPALELVEVPICQACGTELQGSVCPRCLQRQKLDDVLPPEWTTPDELYHEPVAQESDED